LFKSLHIFASMRFGATPALHVSCVNSATAPRIKAATAAPVAGRGYIRSRRRTARNAAAAAARASARARALAIFNAALTDAAAADAVALSISIGFDNFVE
jgi:hypothetical protein